MKLKKKQKLYLLQVMAANKHSYTFKTKLCWRRKDEN